MISLPSAPPPHYSASTSSIPSSVQAITSTPTDTFFDVVPQSDATSFQVGYLGLEGFQAWIKGDVLIKLDERSRQNRHLYKHCIISLIAKETDKDQVIPFFSATQLLWQKEDVSSSASSSTLPSTVEPSVPSTLPFSFQLTDDLPHCIHLPTSSLEYRLEAILESKDESTLASSRRSTIVHLTRYSRPGSLQQKDLEPHTWQIETPTPMTVRLLHTLYRRAEPIIVDINIPPPDKQMLSLGLRSVEANLYRVIQVKDDGEKHELLLAHSGKLCRFHSTRSIVLRLALHPPFDSSNMPYPHPDHDAALSGPVYGRGGGGGCESISQETLLHKVSFLVKILIGIRGEGGQRRDVVLQREVNILPGAAGDLDLGENNIDSKTSTSKKAEAEELAGEAAGPSNWSSPILSDEMEDEEYDGYEDVGRPLGEQAIEVHGRSSSSLQDVDGPPPTLLESRNDLQVEMDLIAIGNDESQSPPEVEPGYVWRQEDTSHSEDDQDDLLPPLPTPSNDDEASDVISRQSGPHRPPPYVAEALRTPRMTGTPPDAHPPAYPHPPLSTFIVAPHPPSYEA